MKTRTIRWARRRARRGSLAEESHTGTPKLTSTIDRMMSLATGTGQFTGATNERIRVAQLSDAPFREAPERSISILRHSVPHDEFCRRRVVGERDDHRVAVDHDRRNDRFSVPAVHFEASSPRPGRVGGLVR
jgi:hypothetical protein